LHCFNARLNYANICELTKHLAGAAAGLSFVTIAVLLVVVVALIIVAVARVVIIVLVIVTVSWVVTAAILVGTQFNTVEVEVVVKFQLSVRHDTQIAQNALIGHKVFVPLYVGHLHEVRNSLNHVLTARRIFDRLGFLNHHFDGFAIVFKTDTLIRVL
jgi:hypothetical protein